MPEIRDTDWAYAAGFVDGEGCIAIARAFSPVRNRFYYTIQVVVANTDRSVLDWMKAAWGGHVVAVIQTQGDGRNSWTWRRHARTSSAEQAHPWPASDSAGLA